MEDIVVAAGEPNPEQSSRSGNRIVPAGIGSPFFPGTICSVLAAAKKYKLFVQFSAWGGGGKLHLTKVKFIRAASAKLQRI